MLNPSRLKYLLIALFIQLGILFGLIRFQGLQFIATMTGSGFVTSLPDVNRFPAHATCNIEPVRVLSYNVMYGSTTIEVMAKRFRGSDTGHGDLPWSVRLPEIRERILSYAPDLVGLQEMESDADIGAIVPLDNYTLVSYHLGGFQYGDSALLFKTARFEKLSSGQFWLGPTPELPMALGFSPLAMIRYVNWAELREKSTGFVFMFVNTHFDNDVKNKEPSATLFRERIAQLAKGMPMIVTGDFNTRANTGRYARLTGSDDNPPLLNNTYNLVGDTTVHLRPNPKRLIDHILVGGPCKAVTDQWLVDQRPLKNGKAMSDHHPVFASLRFTS